MFSTFVVLAVGAGMAAIYLQPDTATAPDRINAASIRPADAPNLSAPAATIAQPVALKIESAPAASPPPTVALPSGPLLRSATDSPPIDTSSLDPAMVVRRDPDVSPGLPGQTGALAGPDANAPGVQAAPVARPTALRRSRPRAKTAQTDKRVEKLFLNPLGVR